MRLTTKIEICKSYQSKTHPQFSSKIELIEQLFQSEIADRKFKNLMQKIRKRRDRDLKNIHKMYNKFIPHDIHSFLDYYMHVEKRK